jgi:hypothetical protein
MNCGNDVGHSSFKEILMSSCPSPMLRLWTLGVGSPDKDQISAFKAICIGGERNCHMSRYEREKNKIASCGTETPLRTERNSIDDSLNKWKLMRLDGSFCNLILEI